jgi:hypothetical protein
MRALFQSELFWVNLIPQGFTLGCYDSSFQDGKTRCLPRTMTTLFGRSVIGSSNHRAEGAGALKTRVITAQGQDR